MNEITIPGAPTAVAIFDAGIYESVFRLADRICKSNLVPAAYKNKPEDTAIAMLMAIEQGAPALTSLGSIATINGKPAWYGDAIPGIAMRKKMIKHMTEGFEGEPYDDDFTAWCEVVRPDGSVVRQTFSVQEAKDAGLWTKAGPWKQYPRRMLQMRARSWAIRDAAPHAFLGPTVEELEGGEDLPMRGPDHARDITPPKAPTIERRSTSKAKQAVTPEIDLSGAEPGVAEAVAAQAPIATKPRSLADKIKELESTQDMALVSAAEDGLAANRGRLKEDQAVALEAAIENAKRRLDPSLPTRADRYAARLAAPGADLDQLGRQIAADPILQAAEVEQLLQMVADARKEAA